MDRYDRIIIIKDLFENVLGLDMNNPNTIYNGPFKCIIREEKYSKLLSYYSNDVILALKDAYPNMNDFWRFYREKDFIHCKEERVSRVRWLVETRLSLQVSNELLFNVKGSSFSRNNLHYLLSYYGKDAVYKALKEAYPEIISRRFVNIYGKV